MLLSPSRWARGQGVILYASSWVKNCSIAWIFPTDCPKVWILLKGGFRRRFIGSLTLASGLSILLQHSTRLKQMVPLHPHLPLGIYPPFRIQWGPSVINWLPGTTPKLALCMLTWKDTLLSERNNVPFFLCVFCIVAYKYTCNGILNELNSVKYNHVSAFFPTTAFTQAALNAFSHHPSHDVSSRSHRFLVTFRWKESHIHN